MSTDPAARATAIRALRYRDLKDPAVLADVLAACRDATPVPGAAPKADVDPFRAFFDHSAPSPDTTVADVAAERLAQTGFPDDTRSAELLAEALRAPGPAGTLPGVAAAALGETRWIDLEAALKAVVPALVPHDEPLYQTIARLPEDGWRVLAELAAAPLAPRLWQELLNHAPAHPLAVDAVVRAVTDGRLAPDEGEAATLLGVLASWGEEHATRDVAEALEAAFPWATSWPALEDAGAAERLAAWLATGSQGPEGLAARVAEVLRHRGPSPTFPLAAWLAWAGDDHGVVGVWGAEAPEVRAVLEGWVAALADEPERGWRAAASLAPDLSDAARDALAASIDTLPWDGPTLAALADVAPPLPWLPEALAAGVAAHPEDVAPAVGAVKRLGPGACRLALVAGLERAAAAPEITTPAGRGTVRVERDGVDVEALRPLADVVGDPDLAARLDELAPVVRGA